MTLSTAHEVTAFLAIVQWRPFFPFGPFGRKKYSSGLTRTLFLATTDGEKYKKTLNVGGKSA